MSIEDKLLGIIKLIQKDYQKYADPKNADKRIAQIKNAFIEEGYVQIPKEVQETWRDYNRMAGFMTGQEFYDRFQLAKMGVVLETGTQNITRRCVFAAWDKADEAAKRAAGLDK